MNENESTEIVVTALSRSRTFPDREALAEHVIEILDHRGGVYDPLEVRCIQELARLNGGGGDPRVLWLAAKTKLFSPPARPKIKSPLDGRIAETEREAQEAEAKWIAAKEAWRPRARELEEKAALRLRKAAGNPTRIAAAQSWIDAGQAEVAVLAAAEQLASTSLRMARARLTALHAAASRWRSDQEVRLVVEGKTLTLEQYAEWKRNR